jgi:Zn-dependent M28 family amino/carboxypeptidase
LDDHVPFLEKGIPAVDLIDIHDPRWHTATDDLENVSIQSLQRIGDTLHWWILAQ